MEKFWHSPKTFGNATLRQLVLRKIMVQNWSVTISVSVRYCNHLTTPTMTGKGPGRNCHCIEVSIFIALNERYFFHRYGVVNCYTRDWKKTKIGRVQTLQLMNPFSMDVLVCTERIARSNFSFQRSAPPGGGKRKPLPFRWRNDTNAEPRRRANYIYRYFLMV